MLFSLETVALTKRQEEELKVTELKRLRFSLDRIRNKQRDSTAQTFWRRKGQIEMVWTCAEEE